MKTDSLTLEHTEATKVKCEKLLESKFFILFYCSGDHSYGKPGTVRKLKNSQEKVGK